MVHIDLKTFLGFAGGGLVKMYQPSWFAHISYSWGLLSEFNVQFWLLFLVYKPKNKLSWVEPQPHIVEPQPHIVEPQPHIVEPQPHIVEPQPHIVEPQPHIGRIK